LIHQPTQLPNLIAGGLYLGLILLVGYAAICLILNPGRRHWLELIGLCFAAGGGVVVLMLFYVSLAGARPDRTTLAVIGAIAVIVIVFQHQSKKRLLPTVPAPRTKTDPLALLGLGSLALILLVISRVSSRSTWPVFEDIDAFAIWMFKAKWVALQPLLPIPPEFRDPSLSYSHQDYPLGFPLLIAGLYAMAGRIDDTLAGLLLLAIYLAMIAVMYSAVRTLHRRAIALILTAIFIAAPQLSEGGGFPVPETWLILQYTAALSLLLRWMQQGNRRDLMLAALFMAAAAFAKNEGTALAALMALVAILHALLQKKRKSLLDFTSAACIGIPLILPWLIYRAFLPKTHEDYGGKLSSPGLILQNLGRVAHILPAYVGWLFNASRFGLLGYLLVIAALMFPKAFRRAPVLLLWAILLIQLGLYLATFIVTPWDVGMLMKMVTPRLLTQASPVMVMLIALHMRHRRATA
jgi:hypothetical protein